MLSSEMARLQIDDRLREAGNERRAGSFRASRRERRGPGRRVLRAVAVALLPVRR